MSAMLHRCALQLGRQVVCRHHHGAAAAGSFRSGIAIVPSLPNKSVIALATTTTTQQQRWYRGEAQESEPRLSEDEELLLRIAKPKSDIIYQKHVALPDPSQIPLSSWGKPSSTTETTTSDAIDMDNVRRKRLVYRSKQRGWLEVDLLLGTWANEHVPTLSQSELDDFEAFVNLETIDIYNVITLRVDVSQLPIHAQSNIVQQIQDWARNSPLGKADPKQYEQIKSKANLI